MKSKVITALMAVGIMASVVSATVVSKNGIAKDSVTGLEWQDNEAYSTEEEEATTNIRKAGNLEYAEQYCKNLDLGGKSDWRLPNIYELATLFDATKRDIPYIIDGFMNKSTEYFWSSTVSSSNNSYQWLSVFYFSDEGSVGLEKKNANSLVRCVAGRELTFDSLLRLKKEKKVKVSQAAMDKINPEKYKRKIEELKKQAEKERKDRQNTSSSSNSNYKPNNNYKFECNFCCDGRFGNCMSSKINVTVTAPEVNQAINKIKDDYESQCKQFPFSSDGSGSASVGFVNCQQTSF